MRRTDSNVVRACSILSIDLNGGGEAKLEVEVEVEGEGDVEVEGAV